MIIDIWYAKNYLVLFLQINKIMSPNIFIAFSTMLICLLYLNTNNKQMPRTIWRDCINKTELCSCIDNHNNTNYCACKSYLDYCYCTEITDIKNNFTGLLSIIENHTSKFTNDDYMACRCTGLENVRAMLNYNTYMCYNISTKTYCNSTIKENNVKCKETTDYMIDKYFMIRF